MELEDKRTQIKQRVIDITSKGQHFIENGQRNEALGLFIKAYALAQKTQDDNLERTCALNLGAAYIEAGNPYEALKSLDKAKPAGFERDRAYIGDLYYNYAEAHAALKNVNKSLQYYSKASDEFESNEAAKIDCLEKCIQLYTHRGDYSKVVDTYKRMIAVYKVQGDSVKLAACLCNLATKQKQADDDEVALASVQEADEILRNLLDKGEESLEEKDMAGIRKSF